VRHALLDPVLDAMPAPGRGIPAGGAPPASRAGPRSGDPVPAAVALDEAGLRQFYDPAGRRRHQPAGALLADVAGSRTPFALPPVGRLTGPEVVLAEALHAGLERRVDARCLDPAAGGLVLPVPPGRQRAIAAAVDRYADTVAAAVVQVADDVRGDPPIGEQRLVRAGSVLAAVAHDGAVRRTGRPFWWHPHEVATILALAWRRRAAGGSDVDPGTSQFLAYCHDAYEDALDPVAGYLSARAVVVSPRVVAAVLTRLAVPDPVGVARVLLLLTRTRATDGSRLPYLDYLDRGIGAGEPHFTLVKAADIHHNLTIEPDRVDPADPRAPARYGKQEAYRTGAARLRVAAAGHADHIARTTRAVSSVGPADLAVSARADAAAGPARLAAAVRERIGR
jgi:hypothetical protein